MPDVSGIPLEEWAKIEPTIIPAVLGWSNPGTAGGENVRLYALDKGDSPRWDGDGRTIERALIEHDEMPPYMEGDRYLVVRIGDRYISDKDQQQIIEMIKSGLELVNGLKNLSSEVTKAIENLEAGSQE